MDEVRSQAELVSEQAGQDIGDAWIFVLRICDLAALGKGPASIATAYANGFEVGEDDVRQIDVALQEHANVVDALRMAYSLGFAKALERTGHPQKAWDSVNAVREAVFGGL